MAQVIVAVMYVLTARDAGPASYGQLAAAIALGGSAMGFFDFGTTSYWIRERASGRMDVEDYSARVTKKIGIAALLFVVALAVCILWFPGFVPACAIFFAGTTAQAALLPLRAARRGEIVAALSITERASALGVFLILLLCDVDPLNALWTSLVSGTLVMGSAAYLSSRDAGRAAFIWKRWSNPWSGAKYYGLSSVASSGQQLDLPVLTAVAGAATAGIYGGVNRWTQPMGVMATAFASASAPFIAHAQDWKTTRRMVTRASWLLVLAVGVCVALAISAPWVVGLLLGPEFATSAPVLQWLAIGTIPAILNQPLAAALQARRYDHLVAGVYLGSVVVQLGLVAWLGFALGALGAAVAFFILQILMLVSLSISVAVAVRKDAAADTTDVVDQVDPER